MAHKRLSWLSVVLVVVLLVTSLFMFGCQEEDETPEKSLTIGMAVPFSMAQGLDWVHATELMAAIDNQNGGLEIGGERYYIEVIAYDNNYDQATDTAAINKLLYEDEVDYIFTMGPFVMSWIDKTEAEHVIVLDQSDTEEVYGPDYHYVFAPNANEASAAAAVGWFCDNYPDEAQNMVIAIVEGPYTELVQAITDAIFSAFGLTPTYVTYPADTADLSALGTKVMDLNPSCFMATGAGDLNDALAYKAVWQAGYRGLMFSNVQMPVEVLGQTLPVEALESELFLCLGRATDFDPGLTDVAQEFKEAWIAEYGEWEGVNGAVADAYSCLRTALQAAGTTDPDAVAAVIGDGMEYESPSASDFLMINRPDLGNECTINSISVNYIKTITPEGAELVATISLEDTLRYFREAYPTQ